MTRLKVCCAALVVVFCGIPAAAARSATPWLVFGGVRWGATSVTPRIYLVRADGTGMRALTHARGAEDVAPAFSPDGGRIAFGRRDATGWRLFVMNADGTHQHAITPRLSLAGAPAWSPDGRRLALEWMPLHPPGRLFAQQIAIVGARGGKVRAVTSNARFSAGTAHPAWSPDGRTIVFSARRSLADDAVADLWQVKSGGSTPRRIVRNGSDPAVSPTGDRIAFSRAGDLYTVDAAGAALQRLTNDSYADNTAPAWSPDGRLIASSTMYYNPSRVAIGQRLTLVNADGTGRHEITRLDPDFWADAPDWRPTN